MNPDATDWSRGASRARRIAGLPEFPSKQDKIVALLRQVLFYSVEGTSVIARTTTLRFLGKATLRTTLLLSRSNE